MDAVGGGAACRLAEAGVPPVLNHEQWVEASSRGAEPTNTYTQPKSSEPARSLSNDDAKPCIVF